MTSKSRDELTKTTDENKIELQEEDLNRVVGGRKAGEKPVEFLKIIMKDLIIT
jgi:hypothetical protein